MDRDNHYNNDPNIPNDNNITNNTINDNVITNHKKSFTQRLGEANVMPDGMLSSIDGTDLAILAIEQGVHEPQVEQENDR